VGLKKSAAALVGRHPAGAAFLVPEDGSD
jgi:hypothetical protein